MITGRSVGGQCATGQPEEGDWVVWLHGVIGRETACFGLVQGRLGNTFYVKENGEDQAIQNAVDLLNACLRQNECVDVNELFD